MKSMNSQSYTIIQVKSKERAETDVNSSDSSEVGSQESPTNASDSEQIAKILSSDLPSDDVDRVKRGLKQLSRLCYITDDSDGMANSVAIEKAGGHSAIFHVMEKWRYNPRIQAEGCRALQNMSVGLGSNFQKAVREAGGLDLFVQAMQAFPDDERVQLAGCGALNNAVASWPANAKYLSRNLEAIDAIINAMKNFSDKNIQRFASSLLCLLSVEEDSKAPVVRSGGLGALSAAIETHKDENIEGVKEIQQFTRKALKNLA